MLLGCASTGLLAGNLIEFADSKAESFTGLWPQRTRISKGEYYDNGDASGTLFGRITGYLRRGKTIGESTAENGKNGDERRTQSRIRAASGTDRRTRFPPRTGVRGTGRETERQKVQGDAGPDRGRQRNDGRG